MPEKTKPITDLRVACLLPSATDIVVSLGLISNLVGVTHECDNEAIFQDDIQSQKNSHPDFESRNLLPHVETLTISQIDPHELPQETIHAKVQESLYNEISLYTIQEEAFERAQPTVILTQALCDVCAPSMSHVKEAVAFLQQKQCEAPGTTIFTVPHANEIKILSLEPECLSDVADSFVQVGEICGFKERGSKLKEKFWNDLNMLKSIVCDPSINIENKPKMFMLEWLQPPFDGGHWVLDQIQYAGCVNAAFVHATNGATSNEATRYIKSKEISWDKIKKSDPDCIVVACCGFDLKRNLEDAKLAQPQLKSLRAYRNNRIYAANGNMYFARPGPYLVGGAALLARCAFDGNDQVVKQLDGLDFMPRKGEGWLKVEFDQENEKLDNVLDIEDLNMNDSNHIKDYMKVHGDACAAKEKMYIDPQSGFSVFTEYAHLQRGKCCGSGCRHCPYNHENLKNKVDKMQQPAFLYKGEENYDPTNNFLSILHPQKDNKPTPVKILFFSGGKDSFLTIRSLVQQQLKALKSDTEPFALVLLTTFDASSRIIAHQEVHIKIVLQQAKHLQIPLIGVPVHRGSSERYVDRIQRALKIIEHSTNQQKARNVLNVVSLVFGDLHLEHIRHWRDTELGGHEGFSRYTFEYPLWKVPYDHLMDDLELSKVPVEISACTVGDEKEEGQLLCSDYNQDKDEKSPSTCVAVGTMFTRDTWEKARKEGLDGFGENGEFHSVAQVWKVSRESALGLPS